MSFFAVGNKQRIAFFVLLMDLLGSDAPQDILLRLEPGGRTVKQ